MSTPQGDYGATLDAIAELVATIEKKCSERATVGVGTPGAISPRTGLIKNANSTILNGRALDRDLTRRSAAPYVWRMMRIASRCRRPLTDPLVMRG